MRQPIKDEAHSLIDYGFAAVSSLGPLVLGLHGPARAIPLAWGVGQGVLNAFTDQPYALRRVVSFRRHGDAEAVALPAFLATVALTRPFEQRRAKLFLGVLLTALVSNYALTDYDAAPVG